MDEKVGFKELDSALRRCGASWDAAQTHGLLTGRLAVAGVAAGPEWLLQVLEGTDEANASREECQKMLDSLYQGTYLAANGATIRVLSAICPMIMPDAEQRTQALAHWCETFLHGLVSSKHDQALKERLGAEPLSDIIRDMLQITRARIDEETDEEDNEAAYVAIV